MENPFDEKKGSFVVLVNDEGQHSLWPSFAEMPSGWRQVHDVADRETCLTYVEANWTDLAPASAANGQWT